MMGTEIKALSKKFESLVASETKLFSEVEKLKNIMGVYIIFNEENEIIYIGSTNKFHVRFGTDLKHETTHTVVRKLIKLGLFNDRKEVVTYLKNKCKMKIEVCDTKREAEALEHIAIFILNPLLNK
jgi:predicted GIY-YIG superfamily endonuclease